MVYIHVYLHTYHIDVSIVIVDILHIPVHIVDGWGIVYGTLGASSGMLRPSEVRTASSAPPCQRKQVARNLDKRVNTW